VLLGNFYSPKQLDEYIKNENENFLDRIDALIQQSYNTRSKFIEDPMLTANFLSVTSSKYCSKNTASSYKKGFCVLKPDTQTKENDFVRFPQASSSSTGCIYDAPLRFLRTQGRNFCPIKITEANFHYNILRGSNFFL
jgi:hypothetical protein